MIGAIIGDIVGSRFEWDNLKSKDFNFLTFLCFVTDDSIMTLAVAEAIMSCQNDFTKLGEATVSSMQRLGRIYPDAGYGGHFRQWITLKNPTPYNSYGNGAAMRVSPCAYAATSFEQALELAQKVTEVTHNHPEGIKGALATTAAIWLAREKHSIEEIRSYIDQHYYPMDFTLDEIRPSYKFDVTCQGTVPQSIMAFLESNSFEDAIRNAISIGGDSDTVAAITGPIAQAYYGVPAEIRSAALMFLDDAQYKILVDFEKRYNY